MPKGTEPTLGLLIQALENDPELGLIMNLDTPTVYLEAVPSPFTYPFMVLVESKEATTERNSETIGGDEDNAFFVEFRRVQVAACSNSGDVAWAMIERFRKKFVDDSGGIAIKGSGNDVPTDAFDISCIPESVQKLQNTHIKDENSKEIWSSMQEYTFATNKLGSN